MAAGSGSGQRSGLWTEGKGGARLALVAVAGPRTMRLELSPPGPLTLGRRSGHVLELSGDDRVSRDHARFALETGPKGARWTVTDTGSRHGTLVNGVKLAPYVPAPLGAGDTVTITPWTFRVAGGASGMGGEGGAKLLKTVDDTASQGTLISTVQGGVDQRLAAHRLALLLECAQSLQAAVDEAALAERVLDAAISGAGFTNAAYLHPLGADGSAEVVAARGELGSGKVSVSRSLIARAAQGEPAVLQSRGPVADPTQSIMELRIGEAVCAPILLAGDVAAYLYLDNRGGTGAKTQLAGDFTGFAVGVARLASMALANLRRLDLEREYARLDAELIAAAEAQRWIFPAREGGAGRLSYIGQTRPGRRLGGDFFDIAWLGEGRLAVALGDVSGKGAGAAVLMTASQGFLHAALREHADPGRAVTALNDFIHPRKPSNRFITLWVGVFDCAAGTLRYVDAGHGYGFVADDAGVIDRLAGEGGLVGIEEGTRFESTERAMGGAGRVIVVSDGLVEQPGGGEGTGVFGVERLVECLRRGASEGRDEVDAIFDAVDAHAGVPALSDDATAVVVRWGEASARAREVIAGGAR